MKRKTHKRTGIIQKVSARCSRFFRTIRIVYSRWHRKYGALRDSRTLLVVFHQDVLSSGVLEYLCQEIEIWLLIGYRVRVREVKEKTIDGRAGLFLWCDGGKPVCRKVIRIRRVDFDKTEFVLSAT